jgi:hypothetical protein
MQKSLKQFPLGWLGGGMMFVSIAYNVVNFVYDFTGYHFISQDTARFLFWFSIGLLILGLCFIAIAIRRYVKGGKDKSLDTEQSLVLTPHTYAIGLSGMTGYPNKPDGAYWLRLEASVNAAYNKPIDTLDLLIGAATIHANSWPRRKVAAFTVYFNVTDWKWKGEIQVELQARIQSAVHSAGRINIDFNAEPGGFPQYL